MEMGKDCTSRSFRSDWLLSCVRMQGVCTVNFSLSLSLSLFLSLSFSLSLSDLWLRSQSDLNDFGVQPYIYFLLIPVSYTHLTLPTTAEV